MGKIYICLYCDYQKGEANTPKLCDMRETPLSSHVWEVIRIHSDDGIISSFSHKI